MEFLNRFFSETLIESVGWTLFHSLWQGALIVILLTGVLYLLKKYASQLRYLISLFALIVLLICAGITFYTSYNYAREKQVLKQTLISDPAKIIDSLQGQLKQTHAGKQIQSVSLQMKWIRFRAVLQRNFPVIFIVWLAGVLFFLLRMAGGFLYLRALRNRQVLGLDDKWIQKINELKNKLGIRKKIDALQSLVTEVPMILGYFRPVLLIPASFLTGLSTSELEAVIAHELAHIRRYDYIINIIQSIIETLFFFHPAVWLISKAIRNEREHSCDELAVSVTGNTVNYIKALALSQELVWNRKNQYALTFSSGKVSLLKRIKRIKNHKIMKNKVSGGFIGASLIFISIIMVSFTIDARKPNREYDSSFQIRKGKTTSIPQPEFNGTHNPAYQIKTKIDIDSLNYEIQESMEDMETLPEDMEQLMEMSCTENDEELALLIKETVNLALSHIDMDALRKEIDRAMREADSAMTEIDIEEVRREAMEEAQAEMDEQDFETTKEALRIANETLEAIDINGIVHQAMKEARIALELVDWEAIRDETCAALEEAEIARKEALTSVEEMERAEKEQKEAIKEMKKAKEMNEETRRDRNDPLKDQYKSMEEQLEELEK